MVDRETFVNYLVLYLKDRHPELDLRRGTAVRDLIVEPLADLFLSFYSDVVRFRDFLRGENLDEEFVEQFLRNFFVERKYGSRAQGIVRVFVGKEKIYRVPRGTKFYYSDDHYYVTEEEYVFPPSRLKFNSLEGLYYFDLPVSAPDVGARYNLPAGSALTPEPFDHYVYAAETATDFVGGVDVEPIESFIRRAYEALTIRNLTTVRAIRTVLFERFDDLLKCVPVGFGDPEMWRDYKEVVMAHIGGHADVWIKFRRPPLRKTVVVGPNGELPEVPGLIRVYGVRVVEADRHSAFGRAPRVRVDAPEGAGVEVLYEPLVEAVDTLLYASDVRPLTVNFMARAMIPVFVSGRVEVELRPGVDLSEVQAKAEQWIYETDELSISDFIDALYDFGVTEVKTPLSLDLTLVTPEYQERQIVLDGKFEIQEMEMSNRTVTYYAENLELVRM